MIPGPRRSQLAGPPGAVKYLFLIRWLCWPNIDPSSLADLSQHALPCRRAAAKVSIRLLSLPTWVLSCLDFSWPSFGLALFCSKDFQVSQFWMQYEP